MFGSPVLRKNGFWDPGGAGPVPVTQKRVGAGPLQCPARIPKTYFDGVWSSWGTGEGRCRVSSRLLLDKRDPLPFQEARIGGV